MLHFKYNLCSNLLSNEAPEIVGIWNIINV